MNKQPYEHQAITSYLLGSLPADQAEGFDELSFTDDDFAAQLQAAEKDLVDAYVNGELTGPELEQFESYYIASPLRRSKVEFARAFQTVAKERIGNVPEPEAAIDETRSKSTIREFFSTLFAAPRSMPQWGFALATLVVVILAGWLLVSNLSHRGQVDQAQQRNTQNAPAGPANAADGPEIARNSNDVPSQEPGPRPDPERELAVSNADKQPQQANVPKQSPSRPVTIASFVLAPQLRGAGPLQTLTIPKSTEWVDVRLELEPNDIPAFRVALTNQSGGQAGWRSGVIKAKGAGGNKSLNIRIPAKLLRSDQIYTLNVSGESDGEIFSNYSFKSVVK